MGYIFLVIAFTLNALANVLLKSGSHSLSVSGLTATSFFANYALLGGLFLFALNIVFYALALARLPLSVAYPVMVAGSLIIVALSSALYLGESITLVQLLGMGMLLLAVVLIVGQW